MDLTKLQQSAGYAVQQAREAYAAAQKISAEHAAMQQELAQQAAQLQSVAQRLAIQGTGGDPSIQRIENVPGRRIPFDLLVDIPIPANSTAIVEGSIPISQEGPFVCVSRMLTCLSAYQFQYTDPESTATATFQGRSFGRWRACHSAWDLNDGQPHTQVVLSATPAFPGNGAPHIVSPPNASPFRTQRAVGTRRARLL
jgi:hypothetical protein